MYSFSSSSSQRIDFGDVSGIKNVANVTLSFWMDISATTNRFDISYYINASNRFVFALSGGDLFALVSNGSSAYGRYTWVETGKQHVAMVLEGGGPANADRLKLYVNGSYIPFDSFSGTIPSTTSSSMNNFYMGFSGSSNYTDGEMGPVKLWDAALSANDIRALYESYLGGPPFHDFYRGNLVANWELGRDAIDNSGNGYHGTLVNSPALSTHPRFIEPYQDYSDIWANAGGASASVNPYYYQTLMAG